MSAAGKGSSVGQWKCPQVWNWLQSRSYAADLSPDAWRYVDGSILCHLRLSDVVQLVVPPHPTRAPVTQFTASGQLPAPKHGNFVPLWRGLAVHIHHDILNFLGPQFRRSYGEEDHGEDTHDDNEIQWEVLQHEESVVGMRWYTIMPENTFRLWWDLVIMILIVFYAFQTPVNMCFSSAMDTSNVWWGIESFFTSLFIIDMIFNFFTGFRADSGVHEGLIVCEPRLIARHYFQTGKFFTDLIGSLPLDPILTAYIEWDTYNRLIRAHKLFRMLRISKVLKRLADWMQYEPATQRLVFLFTVLLFMWHVIGCIYWFVSSVQGFGSDNGWVPSEEDEDRPFFSRYIRALSWAVMVTTGTGKDILPETDMETLFTIVATVVGVLMYAFIVGSASSALASIDSANAEIRSRMEEISAFLTKRKVSPSLQKTILDYYEYRNSATTHRADELDVFRTLHPTLLHQLNYEVNSDMLQKVKWFREVPKLCLLELISKLRQQVYLPGEVVIRIGDIGREMYFVVRGQFEVLDKNNRSLTVLVEGMFFGETAMLTAEPRNACVRSVRHGELLVLEKKDLNSMFKKFPKFKTIMERHAPNQSARSKLLKNKAMMGLIRRIVAKRGKNGAKSGDDVKETPGPRVGRTMSVLSQVVAAKGGDGTGGPANRPAGVKVMRGSVFQKIPGMFEDRKSPASKDSGSTELSVWDQITKDAALREEEEASKVKNAKFTNFMSALIEQRRSAKARKPHAEPWPDDAGSGDEKSEEAQDRVDAEDAGDSAVLLGQGGDGPYGKQALQGSSGGGRGTIVEMARPSSPSDGVVEQLSGNVAAPDDIPEEEDTRTADSPVESGDTLLSTKPTSAHTRGAHSLPGQPIPSTSTVVKVSARNSSAQATHTSSPSNSEIIPPFGLNAAPLSPLPRHQRKRSRPLSAGKSSQRSTVSAKDPELNADGMVGRPLGFRRRLPERPASRPKTHHGRRSTPRQQQDTAGRHAAEEGTVVIGVETRKPWPPASAHTQQEQQPQSAESHYSLERSASSQRRDTGGDLRGEHAAPVAMNVETPPSATSATASTSTSQAHTPPPPPSQGHTGVGRAPTPPAARTFSPRQVQDAFGVDPHMHDKPGTPATLRLSNILRPVEQWSWADNQQYASRSPRNLQGGSRPRQQDQRRRWQQQQGRTQDVDVGMVNQNGYGGDQSSGEGDDEYEG